MNFLIDQQLPATLADWFGRKGFTAVHVRDLGMRDAADPLIWRYALEHDAVVVTKDEDFAIMRSRADAHRSSGCASATPRSGCCAPIWMRSGRRSFNGSKRASRSSRHSTT